MAKTQPPAELKACIAVQITAETILDKDLLRGVLTHEFRKLVSLAGLGVSLARAQGDPNFAANWAIVLEREPDARYISIDVTSAQQFVAAVADPTSGVFQWIKAHW